MQMELYRNSGLLGVLFRQERRRIMVSRCGLDRESSDESGLNFADIRLTGLERCHLGARTSPGNQLCAGAGVLPHVRGRCKTHW